MNWEQQKEQYRKENNQKLERIQELIDGHYFCTYGRVEFCNCPLVRKNYFDLQQVRDHKADPV